MNLKSSGHLLRYLFVALAMSFFSANQLFSQIPSLGNSTANLKVPMEMPLVDTTVKWVQLMLSPRPNYYEVKRAFEKHFGGVVPYKGQGYKVFKRWEYRVINHLDSEGYVDWNFGVIDELAGNVVSGGTSSGSGSGSSGSSTGSGSSGGSGSRSSGSSSGSGGPTGGKSVNGLNGGKPVAPATWCPTAGRWSAVGPVKHPYNQTSQPTGTGRINGIAFHPTDTNTIFAMAPQGGVWKTTDYGANWSLLWGAGNGAKSTATTPSNPFLTIGASSMVVSYVNPDTMYIGTGDRDAGDAPGYGVLMSSDGGKTFVSRNTGFGNYPVNRLVMHPKNSAVLLAANNLGISKSINSGKDWTPSILPGATTANFTDLVYHPYNPSIVYASGNGAFYRSTDGGDKFVQIANGLPITGMQRGQIAVSKADRNRVYFLVAAGSRFQGLYLSIDSGLNFVKQNTTPSNILGYSELGTDGSGQAWYDLDISADPFNAKTVYVHGINIWKSTDAGVTFKICGHWVGAGGADDIHADQHIGEFNNTGRTLFAGNDGGVYYSKNGGQNWVNITNGIQNSQIYRLAVAQSTDDLGAHGYQDNGSMQHDNGEVFTYYGGDGMDCAVDPKDERYVYGSYVFGDIYRAIERNQITTIAANGVNGITEGGGWLTPFVLQEGNPNRMFAGYNNLWRCDSVKSQSKIVWTKLTTGWTGNVREIKSSISNKRHLYVIRGDGRVFMCRNAEASNPTFVDITPTNFTLRTLEVDPKDTNKIYGASTTAIYQSTNNGSSWSTTPLTTINVKAGINYGVINTLKADSSSSPTGLYIGTDRAMYYYNPISALTDEFSNELPLWMDITDIDIYHSPKGRDYSFIYISTYGRGVWKSPLFDDGSGLYKSKMFSYDSIFAVGGTLKLQERINASVNHTTPIEWTLTPAYGFTWTKGNANSANPELKFNNTGVYSVSLTARSCLTSNTETKKIWLRVFPSPASPSCLSKTNYQTSNYGIGIFKVMMSDNQFESGTYFDDGEYLDKSKDKVFRVKPGVNYSVKVKVGLYNTENVRVFIDYNNDGKFQSYLGEVSAQVSATPTSFADVKIKTPTNLKKNQGLRMRVISDYNSIDTTGCGTCGYGQAEDFSLVYEKTTANFKVDKTAFCAGDTARFTDLSDGLVGQYDWDFGAGAIPAKASGKGPWTVRYSTPGFKTIKLRLNNGEDSIVKSSMLEVIALPNGISRIKEGSNPTCEGNRLVLAASDNQSLSLKYNWYKIESPWNLVSSDSLFTISHVTSNDSGKYVAILENRGCFDTTSEFALKVWSKPLAKIGYDPNYYPCLRGNKFTFTDLSTVANSTIFSRRWSSSSPVKSGTSTTFTQSFTSPGNQSIQLIVSSAEGCLDTETVMVKVKGHPVSQFAFAKAAQCDKNNRFDVVNASVNPASSGGGSLWYVYDWKDGNAGADVASASHNYAGGGKFNVQLIVKNALGCSDTSYQLATVVSTPKADFNLAFNEICAGEYLKITDLQNAYSDPSATAKYDWSWGDGRSHQGKFSPKSGSVRDTSINYPVFGNFIVKLKTVTSILGCGDSMQKSFTVYSIPNAKVTVNQFAFCANMQTAIFGNQSTNADGKKILYNWSFGDGDVSSALSPSHTYKSAGKYVVQYRTVNPFSSGGGCADSISLPTITVVPEVDASFTFAKNPLEKNRESYLFDALDNKLIPMDRTFKWDFGFGDTSAKGDWVSHVFNSNGQYRVVLTAINGLGCRDTSSQWIVIESPKLKNQDNPFSFYVFPNPTAKSVNYKFEATAGSKIKIQLHTILGQGVLYERNWDIQEAGTYFETIDLKRLGLSAGVYPLSIESGDQRLSVKIILIE